MNHILNCTFTPKDVLESNGVFPLTPNVNDICINSETKEVWKFNGDDWMLIPTNESELFLKYILNK